MSTIPDPALTDWVPLWNLGAPSGCVMIEDKLLGEDGPIDFVNIPQAYKHLMLVGSVRGTSAVVITNMLLQLNGDAGANYDSQQLFAYSATAGGNLAEAFAVGMPLFGAVTADAARANRFSPLAVEIPDYASTTREKGATGKIGHLDPGVSAYVYQSYGWWRSVAAVNRVTLVPGSGTWKAGSRVTLYALTDVTAPPAVWTPPTYGTSLPGSPADGQEHTLVDSLTNPTYQWRFRYNAGNSTAYKWEFVGGSPLIAEDDTSAGGSASSFADPSSGTIGPSVTLPRAGVYEVTGQAHANASGVADSSMTLGVAYPGVAGTGIALGRQISASANSRSGIARTRKITATGSGACKLVYMGNGSGYNADYRSISVRPVRV